jgi:predicted RecA/RadA family phage recombinase
MKKFVQPGDVITVTAPTGGVTSGQLVIISALVGVASTTQPAGADVEIATEGVFDLAKNPPDALPDGAVAKVTAGSGIIAAGGTLGVGWVVMAAPSGSAIVRVKLTPLVASPPTAFAETEHPPKQEHEREPVGAGPSGTKILGVSKSERRPGYFHYPPPPAEA